MTHSNLELWLVRHGETTWNEAGRLAGWSDVPLTQRGMRQAELLKPRLAEVEFQGIWSSDLVRAVATARLAFGEPTQDSRLKEIHFGDWEGNFWQDLDAESQNDMNRFSEFAFPQGENVQEFEERIFDFLRALSEGRHLLFAHGGVIRIITRELGFDKFVQNGALVGADWPRRKLLFLEEFPRE